MADYSKMYKVLFNAITDSIGVLQKAQQETEEIYVSSPETDIRVLDAGDKEDT